MKKHFLICVLSIFYLTAFGQVTDGALDTKIANYTSSYSTYTNDKTRILDLYLQLNASKQSKINTTTANYVYAGATSGGAAAPVFRLLVSADLPSSVALAGNPTTTTQSANDNSTKIATTAYVDTGLAQKGDLYFGQDSQTTSYTLALGNSGRSQYLNSGSTITVNVPTNASVAFPINTLIQLYHAGAGSVAFTAAGGVTVTPTNSSVGLASIGQGKFVYLQKIATDTWILLNGVPIAGQTLSVSNDTNLILTPTGSNTTAVLTAMGLTISFSGTLGASRGGLGTYAATSATTGTMTTDMTNIGMYTVTPTGSCTFNATNGAANQRSAFVITTSGTSSYTMTWGTNFKTTGTLATGTSSGKVFVVSFIYDGTNWNEVSRTTAM